MATAIGSETAELTPRRVRLVLVGLVLSMFLGALDQNIVATSIRTVADDLHGLDMQAWATTAYLLTATVSTPLYGKLSDLYGRRPLFLTAIALFLVGSTLAAVATSMSELAAFRAVQGLGGGGLMSLALTVLGDIVSPRERARYQGLFLAVFGTSSVLGPILGGFLAGAPTIAGVTGWRWVFLINLPIGAVAFAVVWRVLHLPHHRRDHRIDWYGAGALVVALVPLLVVAEQGRQWGWTAGAALACYGIGAVGVVAFLLAERRLGEDAVLPLRLFAGGVFRLTTTVAVVVGVGLFGGVALLPLYLQVVTGSTPTQTGLRMIPMVAGILLASIVSGRITTRTGRYKIFSVLGLGLAAAGMLLFQGLLHADTAYWTIATVMVVFGVGLGLSMQTLVLATQNAVPARDLGTATASATLFRQMGGALGVAVLLSVVFSTVGDSIRAALARALTAPEFRAALADPVARSNPADSPAFDPGNGIPLLVRDSSSIQHMDGRLAQPFLAGFSASLDLAFLVGAGVLAVGFVLIWFLREIPLRTESGIDARRAEAASREDTPP